MKSSRSPSRQTAESTAVALLLTTATATSLAAPTAAAQYSSSFLSRTVEHKMSDSHSHPSFTLLVNGVELPKLRIESTIDEEQESQRSTSTFQNWISSPTGHYPPFLRNVNNQRKHHQRHARSESSPSLSSISTTPLSSLSLFSPSSSSSTATASIVSPSLTANRSEALPRDELESLAKLLQSPPNGFSRIYTWLVVTAENTVVPAHRRKRLSNGESHSKLASSKSSPLSLGTYSPSPSVVMTSSPPSPKSPPSPTLPSRGFLSTSSHQHQQQSQTQLLQQEQQSLHHVPFYRHHEQPTTSFFQSTSNPTNAHSGQSASSSSSPPLPPSGTQQNSSLTPPSSSLLSRRALHLNFVPAVLGHGSFATVVCAQRRSDNVPVAVKVFDMQRHRERQPHIENEIMIMKNLSHDNVVNLVDYFMSKKQIYIVTDLADGGDLFHRIVARGRFPESEAARLVLQLVRGISYLHDNDIVHRDIKPENLLFSDKSESARLMIADFGSARKLSSFSSSPSSSSSSSTSFLYSSHSPLHSALGSPGYMAPEILLHSGHGKPVDMWSVGIISYVLLGGYLPFRRCRSLEEERDMIIKSELLFPAKEWKEISSEAHDFVSRLLKVTAGNRMTADQALRHPWLSGIAAAQ